MAQGKAGSSSPPSTTPKPGSQLDTMLGSLQSDLNKLGVATVAKGVCGACKKPIAGQVVTAMGKTWHPEHFVCTHCQEEIGSRNFFERDGQPYCEKDYHNLFSPRCYYCNGPILDKVVTALDRTWHPEHFFCAQCGAFFGPEGFHEKDGKAYCRKDYFDMFAPKCGGCARAILENYISALNTLWHPECFVCRVRNPRSYRAAVRPLSFPPCRPLVPYQDKGVCGVLKYRQIKTRQHQAPSCSSPGLRETFWLLCSFCSQLQLQASAAAHR